MEDLKRGRGIPKGEHKILRTAWRKSDDDDMRDYNKIEETARKKQVKKSDVAKDLIKKSLDDLESDY